jgi:hypothetical protein
LGRGQGGAVPIAEQAQGEHGSVSSDPIQGSHADKRGESQPRKARRATGRRSDTGTRHPGQSPTKQWSGDFEGETCGGSIEH